MATGTLTLISIIVFVGVLSLWSIGIFNALVRLYALVAEGWSGISVQLKRRADLIPNLVAVVKQYSIHERDVLEEVTRMRSISMHAQSIGERVKAEGELTGALKTLFAVAENYPNLKANENFMALHRDLTAIEEELQLSRRYYNGTARNYNISVQAFPSSLIARLTGFTVAPYFELESEAERHVPKIEF
ncbi:MAG: LemA family protein [Candidatus Dependentiae bacterium]|nr:LemA family protein [Candidatus Dependentiae bacterium]